MKLPEHFVVDCANPTVCTWRGEGEVPKQCPKCLGREFFAFNPGKPMSGIRLEGGETVTITNNYAGEVWHVIGRFAGWLDKYKKGRLAYTVTLIGNDFYIWVQTPHPEGFHEYLIEIFAEDEKLEASKWVDCRDIDAARRAALEFFIEVFSGLTAEAQGMLDAMGEGDD